MPNIGCLSRTRSANKCDGLISSSMKHWSIGRLCNAIDVWWHVLNFAFFKHLEKEWIIEIWNYENVIEMVPSLILLNTILVTRKVVWYLDNFIGVDSKRCHWINWYDSWTGKCMCKLVSITLSKCVKNWRLVKKSQLGQILNHVKTWRICFFDIIFINLEIVFIIAWDYLTFFLNG